MVPPQFAAEIQSQLKKKINHRNLSIEFKAPQIYLLPSPDNISTENSSCNISDSAIIYYVLDYLHHGELTSIVDFSIAFLKI